MIRSLGTQLRSLVNELDGGVQAVYDELGLGFRPRFFPITEALRREPCLSVGEIADRIGVSQPAATQTLNEMKRMGLIEVTDGPDRRSRLIRLGPKADALIQQLEPVWRAVHRAADELDADLPLPLGIVIGEATAALQRRDFAQRIRAQLELQR